MVDNLGVKLLLKISNDRQTQGFTLIELLVVIIILGIVSAIALPAFLGQATRARESEARTNIGAINRAQQGYLVEFGGFAGGNSKSSDDPSCRALCVLDLGIGDDSSGTVTTEFYEYYLDSQPGASIAKATADPKADSIINQDGEIKGFLGCINRRGRAEIIGGNRGSEGGARTPQECAAVSP